MRGVELGALALVVGATGCMGFYAERGVAGGGLKRSGTATTPSPSDPAPGR